MRERACDGRRPFANSLLDAVLELTTDFESQTTNLSNRTNGCNRDSSETGFDLLADAPGDDPFTTSPRKASDSWFSCPEDETPGRPEQDSALHHPVLLH